MSESEQDALLDRLEAARRRKALIQRILIGLVCVGVAAAISSALLAL